MTKKKATARRRPAKKPADKPIEGEGNVQPIGPQYQMSREELLTYQAFKAKFELADEKIKHAQSEKEMASLMRSSLIKNIQTRLSLADKNINIDFGEASLLAGRQKEVRAPVLGSCCLTCPDAVSRPTRDQACWAASPLTAPAPRPADWQGTKSAAAPGIPPV